PRRRQSGGCSGRDRPIDGDAARAGDRAFSNCRRGAPLGAVGREAGATPAARAIVEKRISWRMQFMNRISAAILVLAASTATLLADDWPQWRGPTLNGVSAETGLPLKWSATEGIAWKLPLPALSGATPIVSGDRIFLNVATALRTGSLELW